MTVHPETMTTTPREGRLAGKVALVTGAAGNLGGEIVRHYLREGATVVLTDVNAQGAQSAADRINARLDKPRAMGLPINVAEGASVEEAIYQVVRRFGYADYKNRLS